MRPGVVGWLVLVLALAAPRVSTYTHWVVTENGRIEPKIDSPFYLRRPYDLIALLDQEKRRDDLNKLVIDLVKQKDRIDRKSTEATNYGEQMINNECAALFKMIDNYHFMIASNGSHRFTLDLHDVAAVQDADEEPRCKKYSVLDYSMWSMEHLSGVMDRGDISISACEKLVWYLPKDEEELGRKISYGLMRNGTSWGLYNLGLLYWWWRGEWEEAVECGRRALFYAPLEFRDIPLLNMGGLFQWGLHSEEAVILLRAAIDHNPLEAKNHLSLGNVYGHSKEFEKAMICYKNFNKLQPLKKFDDKVMKVFVQCFLKLHNGFVEYHDTLQEILSDLHDYHSQQQKWLNMQQRLLWELAPFQKSEPAKPMPGQNCVMQLDQDNKVISTNCEYSLDWPPSMQLDVKFNLQKSLNKLYDNNIESTKAAPAKEQSIKAQPVKEEKLVLDEEKKNRIIVKEKESLENMPTVLPMKYPNNYVTEKNVFFDDSKWPTKEECVKWDLPLNQKEVLDLPVFIPPENKGYQIDKMLSDLIDLPEGTQHNLPWYPPLCEPSNDDNDPFVSPSIRNILTKNKPTKSSEYLRKHFLSYVNNGKADEAEIGQRILTAMNRKSGPSWLFAVLASMYWRTRENTKNSLICLNTPISSLPEEYDDVVLISLGSVLQQLGMLESALKCATMANKINMMEPGTNFLLALIFYQKGNPLVATNHLKAVLRVDMNYYDGEALRLLKLWSCRLKISTSDDAPILSATTVDKPEPVCPDHDGFNGEGVICSPNGELCKSAAIQCFRADGTKDVNAVVKPSSDAVAVHQCNKKNLAATSLLSTIITNQPKKEDLSSGFMRPPQDFHMRILFGDDRTAESSIGDFYVSVAGGEDPSAEVMLNLCDNSGTYQLSRAKCSEARGADTTHFGTIWQTINARNINVGRFLGAVPESATEHSEPHCSDATSPMSAKLDHLTSVSLRKQLPNFSELSLSKWLRAVAGDNQASVREVGIKISVALKENTTSWILATAAALYWRVMGNSEEAVTCLRQALTYVPSDMRDIPLINLANVLHRVGFLPDALEVAYIALESSPNYVITPFTIANIHTALGDLEKAVFYYRSSLTIDPNFEPARERLRVILCTLFDDAFRDEVEGQLDN